jgi:hypothetical protein
MAQTNMTQTKLIYTTAEVLWDLTMLETETGMMGHTIISATLLGEKEEIPLSVKFTDDQGWSSSVPCNEDYNRRMLRTAAVGARLIVRKVKVRLDKIDKTHDIWVKTRDHLWQSV